MIDRATAKASITDEIGRATDLLRRIEDWATPTRLPGWSVADLAVHLVGGQAMQADAWRRLASGDDGIATAGEIGSFDRDGTIDALTAQAAALVAALDGVTDEQVATGVCTMPYGALPAGFILLLATMEPGVHASDLAAAAGEDDRLGPVTSGAAWSVIAGALPMLGAGGDGTAATGTSVELRSPDGSICAVAGTEGWLVGAPPPTGATTTICGSTSDLALFALGRRGPETVLVEGDATGAERFKAWFPGP